MRTITDFELNVLLVVRTMEAIDAHKGVSRTIERAVQTQFIHLVRTLRDVKESLMKDRSQQRLMNPTLPELCVLVSRFLAHWKQLCTNWSLYDVDVQRGIAANELFTLEKMDQDDPEDIRNANLCHRQIRVIDQALMMLDRIDIPANYPGGVLVLDAREQITSLAFIMNQTAVVYKWCLEAVKNKIHLDKDYDTVKRVLERVYGYRLKYEEMKLSNLGDSFIGIEGTLVSIRDQLEKELKK